MANATPVGELTKILEPIKDKRFNWTYGLKNKVKGDRIERII